MQNHPIMKMALFLLVIAQHVFALVPTCTVMIAVTLARNCIFFLGWVNLRHNYLEEIAGRLREGKASKAAHTHGVSKSAWAQSRAGCCVSIQRCAITDLLDSLVTFIPRHWCGMCFLVSFISQALSSSACLGFQDWDRGFMMACEVLRAMNQTGSLGFSKIIKTNQDFGNITVIWHTHSKKPPQLPPPNQSHPIPFFT